MINKKVVAIIAVGILLVIGIYFLLVPSGTVGESPWGETGDYGLTGVWKVTPYAVTTDGERIPIVSPPAGFWVKVPETLPLLDRPVQYVEYEIQAQATRNVLPGCFDAVEIDVSALKMELSAFTIPSLDEDADPTHYAGNGHFSKTGFGTTTLTFESGEETTAWTTVAAYTVPTDVQTVVYDSEVPINYIEVIPSSTGPWNNLNDMTLDWREQIWTFAYVPSGIVTFQGLNSEAGNGDILTPELPSGVTTYVIVGQYTADIDWNSQVTYT